MIKSTYPVLIVLFSFILVNCNPPDYSRFSTPTELSPGQFKITQPDLNQRYRADIITIEPGSEIYSAWGHTAIRILDSKNNRDIVFDYGLFDFSDDFAVKFLMGKPAFKVGWDYYYNTLLKYKNDNRRMFTQQLLLTDIEIESLLTKLVINVLPQNRTFQYHHFEDNCTTRIRDKADEALQGNFKSFFANKKQDQNFRDGSMDILLGRPFLWMGTNLILGSSVDRAIDKWQNQFLPMDLMIALDEFRKNGNEDQVGEILIVLEPTQKGFLIDLTTWTFPTITILIFIFLFFILPIVKPEQKISKYAGRVGWIFWNLIAGILGSLLLITWVFTNHDTVYNNINLLGFSPLLLLNVPISLWLRYKKNYKQLMQIHKMLIVPPLMGFLMSLLQIIDQFAWPFLGFATLIQILLFYYFYQKSKNQPNTQKS